MDTTEHALPIWAEHTTQAGQFAHGRDYHDPEDRDSADLHWHTGTEAELCADARADLALPGAGTNAYRRRVARTILAYFGEGDGDED